MLTTVSYRLHTIANNLVTCSKSCLVLYLVISFSHIFPLFLYIKFECSPTQNLKTILWKILSNFHFIEKQTISCFAGNIARGYFVLLSKSLLELHPH